MNSIWTNRRLAGRLSSLTPLAGCLVAWLPCCLLLAAPAAADVRTQVLGTWGGEVRTVYIDEAVDPYLAYVGSGRNLVVLDVTDPANVVELGRIDLGNLVLDVKVRDGYAYVGTYSSPNQFCTVDVSDPANLRVAWASDDHTGAPWEVELYGDLVFVRWGSDLLRFDISNPEAVIWQGWAFSSNVEAVTIEGDLMYWAGGPGWPPTLRVYDLSVDPFSPTLLGSVQLTWPPAWYSPTAITVEGDYAYITTEDYVLAIVDVSNPAAPAEAGYYENIWNVGPFAVTGGLAYIADWVPSGWDGAAGTSSWEQSGGFQIIDVATDPANPTLVNTYQTHGAVQGVEVVGSRAYLMDEGEGLIILDVSTPTDPVRLGNWYSPKSLRKLDKVGDLLYVTDEWNGFTILDVSDPASPSVVSAYQTTTDGEHMNHWGIEVRDDIAYFSAGWGGIELVDVSNPASPFLMGDYALWPAGYAGRALELDGDIAHVGVAPSGGFGFMVNFDISDPNNITDPGSVGLGSPPLTIDTNPAGIAHVAAGGLTSGTALAMVDTSDPAAPAKLYEGLPQACDVVYRDGLLYVADSRDDIGGLRILDVADPANPVELGHFVAHGCNAVAVQGNLAYLVGNDLSESNENGLMVLDVSDPTSPVLLSLTEVPGAQYDILVDGRYVYLTGGHPGFQANVGLIILDIGLPGDLNCDGAVNTFDIDPFVLALTDPVGYAAAYPNCDRMLADIDENGSVNTFDIDPFVQLLTGG